MWAKMYNYQYKFHVYINHSDYESNYSIESIEIREVMVLLDFVDTERQNKKMSVFIEPQNWKNVALVTVSKNNLEQLKRHGATIIESQLLYNDKIDATLQAAFICSKYLIEVKDIKRITNGVIEEETYKLLLNTFYEDFPEKYI